MKLEPLPRKYCPVVAALLILKPVSALTMSPRSVPEAVKLAASAVPVKVGEALKTRLPVPVVPVTDERRLAAVIVLVRAPPVVVVTRRSGVRPGKVTVPVPAVRVEVLVRLKLLFTVVVPVAAPRFRVVAAPKALTVVAVVLNKVRLVAGVAMVGLRRLSVPVVAPRVTVVAAPPTFNVVAVVLIRLKVVWLVLRVAPFTASVPAKVAAPALSMVNLVVEFVPSVSALAPVVRTLRAPALVTSGVVVEVLPMRSGEVTDVVKFGFMTVETSTVSVA
jgi:hypothetical protein